MVGEILRIMVYLDVWSKHLFIGTSHAHTNPCSMKELLLTGAIISNVLTNIGFKYSALNEAVPAKKMGIPRFRAGVRPYQFSALCRNIAVHEPTGGQHAVLLPHNRGAVSGIGLLVQRNGNVAASGWCSSGHHRGGDDVGEVMPIKQR